MWKWGFLHRKQIENHRKLEEKPSRCTCIHIVFPQKRLGRLYCIAARGVARFSTAVHMSYPHVLQRFMNNFAIAFAIRRSYAVRPLAGADAGRAVSSSIRLDGPAKDPIDKCASFPALHHPNRCDAAPRTALLRDLEPGTDWEGFWSRSTDAYYTRCTTQRGGDPLVPDQRRDRGLARSGRCPRRAGAALSWRRDASCPAHPGRVAQRPPDARGQHAARLRADHGPARRSLRTMQLELRRARLDDQARRLEEPVAGRVEPRIAGRALARKKQAPVQLVRDALRFPVQPEEQEVGRGLGEMEQREQVQLEPRLFILRNVATSFASRSARSSRMEAMISMAPRRPEGPLPRRTCVQSSTTRRSRTKSQRSSGRCDGKIARPNSSSHCSNSFDLPPTRASAVSMQGSVEHGRVLVGAGLDGERGHEQEGLAGRGLEMHAPDGVLPLGEQRRSGSRRPRSRASHDRRERRRSRAEREAAAFPRLGSHRLGDAMHGGDGVTNGRRPVLRVHDSNGPVIVDRVERGVSHAARFRSTSRHSIESDVSGVVCRCAGPDSRKPLSGMNMTGATSGRNTPEARGRSPRRAPMGFEPAAGIPATARVGDHP